MLKIKQIPVLNDNYIYLIHDKNKNISACVDPAVEGPVIDFLDKENLNLDFILNTHHHFDHVGANLELKKKYGCDVKTYDMNKDKLSTIMRKKYDLIFFRSTLNFNYNFKSLVYEI